MVAVLPLIKMKEKEQEVAKLSVSFVGPSYWQLTQITQDWPQKAEPGSDTFQGLGFEGDFCLQLILHGTWKY